MDKSELNGLVDEMNSIFEKIMAGSAEHPSIMVSYDDGMVESFSSLCEQFNKRFSFFKRQARKVADKLPKSRRRKKSGKTF